MMITILGLPMTAKYHDLKILIKQQCNVGDFILDSLVSEIDGTKKVRVGLADDSEGDHLIKCLDGFRFGGNILRLVPVGKASSITQELSPFDVRGTYQQSDYSNQNLNDRNRTLDTARPTNWAQNQWSSSQPQLLVQSNFGYQQPVATSYGQPPQNNITSTLREIPQAPSRATSGRYTNQNYDEPSEKPITILKENFQGTNQYNLTSSHSQISYQSQGPISPWAIQQPQLKSYEKPIATFDKKLYDDRKYPSQEKHIQEPTKIDDSYKYEKNSQSYSPQRKDFRDMEERAQAYKGSQYSDRRSTERRMLSNRNMPSSGRHFSPVRQISPSGRHVLLSGRHASPPGRHVSLSGRHVSPQNRHASQSGRHSSPPGRHGLQSSRLVSPGRHAPPPQISPQAGRHVVSSGRYGSPPRNIASTGRHISPPGRHVSTTGRHVSPSGRHTSPSERHIQMKGRQISPDRQMPAERKVSPSRKMFPPRRDSPPLRKEEYVRGRRGSPPSHTPVDRRPDRDGARLRHDSPRRDARFASPPRMDQKQSQYQDDHRNPGMKDVRPAYEPKVQAPNEVMYSGGYRPNAREEAIKYQSRSEHWKERENFSSKSIIDERRESSRMQKFDIPRASEGPRSTEHDVNRSRSPKRDRSPLRDRFKRHSPSPRSPRRSWALEKRRSPEIREPPPPPVWPQEKEEYTQQVRPKFPERDMEKNSPVWETREKARDFQSSDDRRNFSDQRRSEITKWKPIPGSSSHQSTSSRFEDSKPTRKEFDIRQEFIRDNKNRKAHPDRHEKEYHQERSDVRYKSDFDTKDEIPRKRDEFSGHIEEKKKEILLKQEQLQKEIDEVYKRAVDFTKKAEMYRKGELKREGHYNDDRPNPKEMQRFKRDPYEENKDRENFRKDYNRPQYNRDDEKKSVHEDIKKFRHCPDDTQKSRYLSQNTKAKRAKVVEDISDKIMSKHGKFLSGEMKKRVMDELKLTLGRELKEMFEDNDVSYTDMVAKFDSRYNSKDRENIYKDVMLSLPNHYRNMKRHAQDESDVPAKSSRRSPEPSANKDLQSKVRDEQKRTANRREAVKKLAADELKKYRVTETTRSADSKTQKDENIDETQQNDAPSEEGDGQFQLNDLMTTILEDELKSIMIEVWQALPDDPPTEAERFVVDKLRCDASDDLRNVLGLNVTKRLLNIYNPLIVKLQFIGRPGPGCVPQFLNKYNVKTFRQLGKDLNMLAARLTSISDFDKMCTNKDLRCGNAKVTVTPIYKFSKCPANLNTIFNINEEEESRYYINSEDTSESGDSRNNTNEQKAQNNDQEKHAKDVNTEIKPERPEPKFIKSEVHIPSNQISVTKVEQSDNNKDKTMTETAKITNSKPITKADSPIKSEDTNIEKLTEDKNSATDAKKADDDKKASDNVDKQTPINEKPIMIKKRRMTIKEIDREYLNEEIMEQEIQEFNDGDEMDDEEILALMSEGVIVDACSGSDGE